MPGIVTSSGELTGSVHTYKAAFTSTSTSLAINFVSGTTSGATASAADKGIWVMFQNTSTSAANVTIGGPAATVNSVGIILSAISTGAAVNTPNNYVVFPSGSASGINMADWYVCSTSSSATCVAQLLRGV